MSFYDTMRQLEPRLRDMETQLGNLEIGPLLIQISDDWFRKFDIPPFGIQAIDRRIWFITSQQFETLMVKRPGPNRHPDVGYRWKEVY